MYSNTLNVLKTSTIDTMKLKHYKEHTLPIIFKRKILTYFDLFYLIVSYLQKYVLLVAYMLNNLTLWYCILIVIFVCEMCCITLNVIKVSRNIARNTLYLCQFEKHNSYRFKDFSFSCIFNNQNTPY